MYTYPNYGNFDLDPAVRISTVQARIDAGEAAIRSRLIRSIEAGKRRVAMEIYPGVEEKRVVEAVSGLGAKVIVCEQAMLPREALASRFAPFITEDRVFGAMTTMTIADCYDPSAVSALREEIAQEAEPVIVVGTGATLFVDVPDEIWLWDITRWEIQLRYRKGAGTWLLGELDGETLTKYKIGYFLEWRFADRIKERILPLVDVCVDADDPDILRAIDGDALRAALRETARRPFRVRPYYDPSVWGGQWMKNVFGLDPNVSNYGWSFDGVPEENALTLDFDGQRITFPAMDLVLYAPQSILGEHVYGRFGAEFPIRFDLLDTMEGGNLSLQVHPLTRYIQQNFGMAYTQDESYYILDAAEGACVYLGVKTGTDPDAFAEALYRAQAGEEPLDAGAYVNRIPVKKHDHVLIPAGTAHCSGKDTVVLEISATPYIFTFKMWDWGRVGLDGKPRPIHIDHALNNLQFERDTEWVQKHLVHQTERILEDDACAIERTGLHNAEFIETRRITVRTEAMLPRNDSVAVMNLVQGARAEIASPTGAFPPFELHYAETMILPSAAGDFIIRNTSGEKEIKVMLAEVR